MWHGSSRQGTWCNHWAPIVCFPLLRNHLGAAVVKCIEKFVSDTLSVFLVVDDANTVPVKLIPHGEK